MRVFDLCEQVQEFVTAMPADRVVVPYTFRQARRNFFQNTVASGMPMGVIDGFEVVQVDEHHSQTPSLSAGLRQTMLQPVIEQDPVGQTSQRIMNGMVPICLRPFLDSLQLEFKHMTCADFAFQLDIDDGEFVCGFLHLIFNSFALDERFLHAFKRGLIQQAILQL